MGIYYEKERESLRQRYDWPEAEDSKTFIDEETDGRGHVLVHMMAGKARG